eukprot:9390212-Pyramimonas_sp.AAC.1
MTIIIDVEGALAPSWTTAVTSKAERHLEFERLGTKKVMIMAVNDGAGLAPFKIKERLHDQIEEAAAPKKQSLRVQ